MKKDLEKFTHLARQVRPAYAQEFSSHYNNTKAVYPFSKIRREIKQELPDLL